MMREIKKLHHDVVERLYRPSAAGWRNAKLNDLWNARRCPSEYAGDWMFVLKTMPQGPTHQYGSFDPLLTSPPFCFAESIAGNAKAWHKLLNGLCSPSRRSPLPPRG
jgi:hypothetical protein